MLVLSRKVGETICIDGRIKVMIVNVAGNRVKVGIEAPVDVKVLRSELAETSDAALDRHAPSQARIRLSRLAFTPK